MGTIDLNRLGIFVAVAETSSFSAAARRLGLPKSTVSRGVAGLEQELGVRLLHRTTRHVALSTAGAALRARITAPLAALGRSLADLPELEDQPSGLLRVTATVDFGAVVLAEIVAAFVARHPAVEVELRLSNAVVDMVAEGIDVALRMQSRSLADSSLIARRLAPLEMQIFAAPAYLTRRPALRTPRDLDQHDWVILEGAGKLRLENGRRSATVSPKGRLRCDDMFFVHRALRAGAGLGVLPTFLADADVAAGLLARVLPRWKMPTGHVWMLTPTAKQLPRKVVAFREAVIEGIRGRVAET